MSNSSTRRALHISRWLLALIVIWVALAIRIGIAVVRREPLNDTLALPTFFLFVATAILASRIYAAFTRRPPSAPRSSGMGGPKAVATG